MRIIAVSTLKSFWETSAYADAKAPLPIWYHIVRKADWHSPADIKNQFHRPGILQDGRVIFNIGGNKYRLVVWINYPYKVVYIRFIGTHTAYDNIDPQII